MKIVQTVDAKSLKSDGSNPPPSKTTSSSLIVSLMQLKTGIESLLRGQFQQGFLHINLEEWGCLASIFQSNIAEDETYGINARDFLVGSCEYIIGGLSDISKQLTSTAETLSKELRLMIIDEARSNRKSGSSSSGSGSGKGGGSGSGSGSQAPIDYLPVFNLFDTNGSGSVTVDEFKSILNKMKLLDNLPDNQIPVLLSMFDKEKKGYFTYSDFVSYIDEIKKDVSGNVLAGK